MRTLILILLLGLPVWAQDPGRETPPPAGELRPLTLPEIAKGELSNGLAVWVVERPEVPVAQVTLALPAGGERDPSGQFGLASFTSALLTEGAGGKSALELADELDFLGATLSASSGFDGASVDLYVPVARLRPALELMSLVATRPDFPAEEIERHRDEVLTEFLQAREDPVGLMALAFPAVLYPKEHRYGSMNLGQESTIETVNRQHLVDFHRAHYRPDQSLLIVVGDVKASQVIGQLEKVFGGWQAASAPIEAPLMPSVAQARGRRLVVVDRPGAAQTVIRIARLGVARTTPDYYSLTVLNTVLGGSFTSRLNQNLREKNGYTYGARSAFDMRRQPGPFYAGASVQTDKTGAALREFFHELEAIRQPLTQLELGKAKNYLAYGYPADFLSASQFAAKLEGLWTYGLQQSDLTSFVPQVQKVTAADVQRVAEAYIVPQDMAIVMVGDWKRIEPQLAGMDLGPVEMVKP